jgi:putative membrane protein
VDLLLVLVLVFAVLGAGVGIAAGLVPGIHVNNVALVVVATEPALLGALASFAPEAPLVLATFLASCATAHGFTAFLPSVFLGAPDGDTALTVLPGHRLLAGGHGMEAVLLCARGALLAVLLAVTLLLPFRVLLGDPVRAYEKLRPFVPLLLLLLVSVLVATEGRGRGTTLRKVLAIALLGLSGLLGWIVLRPGFLESAWRPLDLPAESLVLFPLFTGLFGLPTLLQSWNHRGRLPPQDLGPADPLPDWRHARGLLSGTLAGATVSWFPGLGGASATVVAQLLAGGELAEGDPEADREFLFASGAANAATTVFTFATLFIVLRARSGVAAAVDQIADGVPVWSPVPNLPPMFLAVVLGITISAVLAHAAVARLARPFARFATRVRYGRLARTVSVALALAVFAMTGPVGLGILGTATALGLLPPRVGVRRVHLMGCLLMPLLVGAL